MVLCGFRFLRVNVGNDFAESSHYVWCRNITILCEGWRYDDDDRDVGKGRHPYIQSRIQMCCDEE